MRALILITVAQALAWAGLTTITDTLYTPAGDLFTGDMTISLASPSQAQPLYNSAGRTLTGFQRTFTVTSGAVSIQLEANDAITPAGTSYWVQFRQGSTTRWMETWIVPTSGSAVTVRSLRSTAVPVPSVMFNISQLSGGGASSGQLLRYSGTYWAPYTFTGLSDPTTTAGDILYRDSGGIQRLPVGSNSQVLTISGGLPTWSTPASAVSSVFGRTGAVTAQSGDYTTAQVTESGNLYYTDARARAAISGTAPVSVSAGVVSMAPATSGVSGYLAAADWAAFTAKESALTFSAPLSRSTNTISCSTCVLTSGSYSDPSWITSLAYSKLTGTPSLSGYAIKAADETITGNWTFQHGSATTLTVRGATGQLEDYLQVLDGAGNLQFGVTDGTAFALYGTDFIQMSASDGARVAAEDATGRFTLMPTFLSVMNPAGEYATPFTIHASTLTLQDNTAGTGNTKLVVKAGADQGLNIQEWQDATGEPVAYLRSNGDLVLNNGGDSFTVAISDGNPRFGLFRSDLVLPIFSAWGVDGNGLFIEGSDDNTGTAQPLRINASTITIQDPTASTGDTKLVVKAGAGQVSPAQEWQTNGGSVIAQVGDDGGGYGLINAFGAGKSGMMGPEGLYFYDVSTGDNSMAYINASTVEFQNSNGAGSTEISVKAGGAQSTNNLQTWRNVAGTVLSSISSTGAFTGNAATATALAANPADCSAGQYASAIAASGDLTCAQVAYSDVSGTPSLATVATSGSASDLGSGTLGAARGGAGTVSGILKANGSGVVSAASAGTDYVAPAGNVATATSLATARAIYGNNFDGSAALTQIIASTYGGTGNGFAKFSGPTTSEKTFTLPNASATILTDNAAVTVGQGGTGLTGGTSGGVPYYSGASTIASSAALAASTIVMGGGAGAAPTTGAGYTVATAGSAGGTNYNQGTSTALARQDHQHHPDSITSNTTTTVNTNTTGDQNLISLTIPAGALNSAARMALIKAAGTYTTQSGQTPTVNLKVKLCTVSGCGSGTALTIASWTSAATTASATTMPWNLDVVLGDVTTGATGTVEAHGFSHITLGTTATATTTVRNDNVTSASAAIDLTGTLYLQVTIAFSTNAATANIGVQRLGAISFVN